MKNHINKRRKFIKDIGLTAMGLSSLPASIFKLKTWAASAANNSTIAQTGDYKALVCFYMFGGNDGFNTLVPSGNEYAEYQNVRGNLALPQSELLNINPLNNQGPQLGLHPSLSGLQQFFEDGKLTFLCNVGTKKVADTTIDNVVNQQNLPLSLFSHNDQARQWETARVNEKSHIGWAGKIADLLGSTCNTNTNVSMNVSMFNNALFLNGEQTNGYSLSKNGPITLRFHHPNHSNEDFLSQRTDALDAMFSHDYQDPFYNNYNAVFQKGINVNEEISAVLEDFENSGGLTSPFDAGSQFSQTLKMVAKSIAVAEDLGFQRQIYFVHVGGYDNHADLLTDHSALLSKLSVGLTEFYGALEEIDKADNVVTFSMSDFGRTLASNGTGSDHAWGSNAIVMGGPVIGNKIYGNYPSLALNSNMVYSNKGILIPEMAADLYFAELAHWFGVAKSDLPLVFPNIGEFYETSSSESPVGFLTL